MGDDAASEDEVVVVKHDDLSRGDRHLRLIKMGLNATGIQARLDGCRSLLVLLPDLGANPDGFRGRGGKTDPVHIRGGETS